MELFNIRSLDVKDEILSSEELYTIKDSTGRVIYDNVKLELKTPLVQKGTPLNKFLFDKIDEMGNSLQSMNPVGETFLNLFRYGYIDKEKLNRETIIDYNEEETRLLLKSFVTSINGIQSDLVTITNDIESLKSRVSKLEG